MSVPADFISGDGPHLVEASAGTGKTTWMVRTAVRLLLQDAGVPTVRNAEHLLAVTFTRAATAELKERLRRELLSVDRLSKGFAGGAHDGWIVQMLAAGGAPMKARLRAALDSIDRLAVTTIHGFCKGVLEEFALECGVPVGLRFIDSDFEYLDGAAADEWRALTWAPGPVSAHVLGARASDKTRWSPKELRRGAERVLGAAGAVRPARAKEGEAFAPVRTALTQLLPGWDEARLRAFYAAAEWNKGKPTIADVDALSEAMSTLARGEEPEIAHITKWARSAITPVATKRSTEQRARLAGESFLDLCERVLEAQQVSDKLLWQEAVLSIVDRAERAMRADRVTSFNGMISMLRDAVDDGAAGERLRATLSSRYDAVLVDEFQDTDWAQWRIFSNTFGRRPLILVGDPKQSIYGFRGADITAYRAAKKEACAYGNDRVASQTDNYRSDAPLIDATEKLFSLTDRPFDVDTAVLRYEPVNAARATDSITDNHPDRRALSFFDLGDGTAERLEGSTARAIADEIARLLSDPGVTIVSGGDAAPRAVKASDIAILVSANRQAVPLQRALRALRIPAVTGTTGAITESPTWHDLMYLIDAIDDHSDQRVVRRALATPIGGYTAQRLLALEQDAVLWRRLVERLAEARHDWESVGVLAALMRLTNEWGAREALATFPDGERRLTDFRHTITLLQEAEREGHRAPMRLRSWAAAFAKAGNVDSDRRQQHLESDAEAVTISTVHGAKGLEWPIVFCGYLWKGVRERSDTPRVARFADGSQRLVFDGATLLDGETPPDSALSEGLRLAYVALTRARSRTYVVWARDGGKGIPPLMHLMGSLAIGGSSESPAAVIASRYPGVIGCSSREDLAVMMRGRAPIAPIAPIAPLARTAVLAPGQTRSWTVSSYTRFTKGLKAHAAVAPTILEPGPVDEAEAEVSPEIRADQLPGGTHTGNALHDLFERLDFTSVGEQATVDAAIGKMLTDFSLPRADADAAQRAGAAQLVRRMLSATLGAPIPGATSPLSAVQREETLREWRFNIPMHDVSAQRLAAVFRAEGGLGARYAAMLDRSGRSAIDGYLTGSVDLVALIDGKWWIIDWKSNTLGDDAAAYDVASCAEAMIEAHYLLQYHLYVVALHRFLRSRLGARYDYERDFGGVGYAFLRGLAMGAPAWFTDRPSLAMVEALDACIGYAP